MRPRGELPEEEEAVLGIERLTPEQEEDQAKELAERLEIKRLFLVSLMNNPMFREWLMEVLSGWNTFGSPFGISPAGFPDPMATQFALGQKAAGWHLWEMFDEADPLLASQMRRGTPTPTK